MSNRNPEAQFDSPEEKRAATRRAARLFAISFLALFLELMLIRWVPAVAQVVAYYTNLMLISSFLGLGMGAMVARRGWRLFRWFPLLLAVTVFFLLLSRNVLLPGSLVEFRFFSSVPGLVNYLVLVGIFVLNTGLFVPLGEQVGQIFESLPPLRAYMWDLGGSFCGTVGFGVFSLLYFSPLLGILAVMLVYLVLTERSLRLPTLVLFALTALGVSRAVDRNTIWSPYQNFTIRESLGSPTVSEPPTGLREMVDPPFYVVSVNQNFYQAHGSVDRRRYSDPNRFLEMHGDLGQVPYEVHGNPGNVLVVGAGGGPDVEGALLAGATHVDAVDIDPVTIRISRQFNSSGVYDDERVTTHITDARAFFRQATPGYDMVVFGFLDSQALSSSMANIRLDGFVYTAESLRAAYRLVGDQGMLSLAFYISHRPWMIHKLYRMVEEGTGRAPIVYAAADTSRVVFIVPKGREVSGPTTFASVSLLELEPMEFPVPTDDWPYLYLAYRTIPSDYLLVIGTLLLLSILAVFVLKPPGIGASHGHFAFLGAGFLLLQTKSIVDSSLYFGATWFVTMLVIAGVLLMVMAANWVAIRRIIDAKLIYVPLIASLLVLILVPREWILALPWGGRLAWTLLAVPLPIFFAGLVFSTTFKREPQPASAFGANLLGATVGGFAEYLGMAVGSQALSLLVIACYLCSYLLLRRFWVGKAATGPARVST
jgi:hypothetical protein